MIRPLPLVLAAAALGLVACDPQHPIEPGALGEAGLEAAYVAGHFGAYYDCPEEAYRPPPPRDADRAEGVDIDPDCAGDDCQLLSCTGARLTVSLSNTAEVDATGVTVLALFVLDEDAQAIVPLPIEAVYGDDGEPFDGELEAGAVELIQIEFTGPYDVAVITGEDTAGRRFSWFSGAPVRVMLDSTSHAGSALDTPVLYSLPLVDT